MKRIAAAEFRENDLPVSLPIEVGRRFPQNATLITFDPADPKVVV